MKKVLLACILFVTFVSPALAADSDGCYQAGNCVSMTAKWNGDSFRSRYTNNCNGRIYINYCNERKNGRSSDCGATGIRPGKSSSWETYGHATGRYTAIWVGSEKGSNDWVCTGKVNGWTGDLFKD